LTPMFASPTNSMSTEPACCPWSLTSWNFGGVVF